MRKLAASYVVAESSSTLIFCLYIIGVITEGCGGGEIVCAARLLFNTYFLLGRAPSGLATVCAFSGGQQVL